MKDSVMQAICRKTFSFISMLVVATPAFAIDPMPAEAGYSGFFRPGAGYVEMETNMIAEFSGFEFSNDPITSLTQSNDSESTALVMMPFNLAYTFDSLQTQVFFGTQITDLARFDFTQKAGVKRKIGEQSLFQASLLFSGFVAEVWSDPYVTNQPRVGTDRDIAGLELAWDKIGGHDFEIIYSFRSIDIDDERSGQFLGLTAAQQALLDRDADQHALELVVTMDLEGNHSLVPSFKYMNDDRDGAARANDQFTLKLTYAYQTKPTVVLVNGFWGMADYDQFNPIYVQKQEDDILGFGVTVFKLNPWDWRLWGSNPVRLYVEAAYYERDADIDFYDEKLTMVTAGILARW